MLMGNDFETVRNYFIDKWSYDVHSDFARLTRWITGGENVLI